MNKLKKWQMVILIIVAIIIGLGLAKNILVKSAVTAGTSFVTGAPVHIDSLGVGIFRPRVSIKGFRIYNPPGFPKEPLVNIPEVTVQYSIPDLLKGKIHVPLLVVDVKEMVIVKNKEGQMNVDALKFARQKEELVKEPAKKTAAEKKPSKKMTLQIDVAKMNLGRVIVKDYTQGEPPIILVYNIGVNDKTYKNIGSAEEFAALLTLEMMGPAGLKSAGIYAAATILGVGFLPAGVAGVLLSSDGNTREFPVTIQKAYQSTKGLLAKIGEVKSEDSNKNIIKASLKGTDVTVEIVQVEGGKVAVTAKARKMMIPRREVAEGVLYQLEGVLR